MPERKLTGVRLEVWSGPRDGEVIETGGVATVHWLDDHPYSVSSNIGRCGLCNEPYGDPCHHGPGSVGDGA